MAGIFYRAVHSVTTARGGIALLAGLLAGLVLSATAQAADGLVVRALLKDKAVIEIQGQQKMLRAGDSFAGVTLISADSQQAVIEVNGSRKTVAVGRHMGARYTEPEKTAVRIASQRGGHYFAPGRINNRPVTFMVDTGATTIAMNSLTARELGIDYLAGQPAQVHTAGGIVQAYQVMLAHAAVGNLVLHNVEASVLEGQFPAQILLGNSYLSRVDMQVDNGVLVLQAKF